MKTEPKGANNCKGLIIIAAYAHFVLIANNPIKSGGGQASGVASSRFGLYLITFAILVKSW